MAIRAVLWDVDDTLFDYTGADRDRACCGISTPRAWPTDTASADQALGRWRGSPPALGALRRRASRLRRAQRRDRVREFLEAGAERRARPTAWFAPVRRALRGRLGALPGRRARRSTPWPPATGTRCCPTPPSTTRTASCAPSGVRDRFEVLLCAAELGVYKPDAGAFLAACEALALPPARGGLRRRPAGHRRARGAATPGCSASGWTARRPRPGRSRRAAPDHRTRRAPRDCWRRYPFWSTVHLRVMFFLRRPSGPKGRTGGATKQTPAGGCVLVGYGVIGNTTVSGSVILGSSPGSPAQSAVSSASPRCVAA